MTAADRPTEPPVECVAVDRDERCLCPGGPASHRPSPPAPAAEDDAVEQRVIEALAAMDGRGYDVMARAALDAAGVSALRAEVERLRLVSKAQPYETERELAIELDEARQQVARVEALVREAEERPYTKQAIDPGEVRAALAGSGEQPGEGHEPDLSDGVPDDEGKALPAGLCYRCQRPAEAHRPAPVVPDSTGLCPGALNVKGAHFPCDLPEGHGAHGRSHASASAEAVWDGPPVLAVVGQGVTAGCCDPSKVETRIEGTWLVDAHPHHTCGTGESGHYGAHEPGCGLVPVVDLRGLPGWDDLRAVVRSGEQGGEA